MGYLCNFGLVLHGSLKSARRGTFSCFLQFISSWVPHFLVLVFLIIRAVVEVLTSELPSQLQPSFQLWLLLLLRFNNRSFYKASLEETFEDFSDSLHLHISFLNNIACSPRLPNQAPFWTLLRQYPCFKCRLLLPRHPYSPPYFLQLLPPKKHGFDSWVWCSNVFGCPQTVLWSRSLPTRWWRFRMMQLRGSGRLRRYGFWGRCSLLGYKSSFQPSLKPDSKLTYSNFEFINPWHFELVLRWMAPRFEQAIKWRHWSWLQENLDNDCYSRR